jgi:SET domain-containing protein
MSGLFRLNSIEVQYSKIGGRGVFAKNPIKKGSIIEEAPFLPVYKEEIGTKMMDYVFDLDEHCYAVCFGYGSLYNHAKRNNCQYEINLKKENTLLFKARRDIAKGEEITVSYGEDWLKNRGLTDGSR